VRDLFCAEVTPQIRSLSDLERALDLKFTPRELTPAPGDTTAYPAGYKTPPNTDATVVLLGHSSALSGQLVSPINPRAILLTEATALAFTRGIQQVEIASHDRERDTNNLYLLRFEQACSAAHGGCSPADLYTPRIESAWTRVSLQDAEELANTPEDCLQCHQRGVDKPLLLMREFNGPWTHFFAAADESPNTYPEPDGGDLARDFLAAKGDESYAGAPSERLRTLTSFTLRNFVDILQPLLFDSLAIERERWPKDADGPQRSPTWDAAYAAFKRGEQLALPYFAPRATDPDKQLQLTAAYRDWRDGKLSSEALPDLADIFPDDAQTRAEIGLQTEPDATAAETLIQACGSCHNDVLDQALSRARFSVALPRLDRTELERAVVRLTAAEGSAGAMPPKGARRLDPDSRVRLINYLQSEGRSEADDALLEHAARAGSAQVTQ
jgi:hypothetical protein